MKFPKNTNELLDTLLTHEGGYVNDPKDPGGETNWGITKNTALANGYNGSMKTMTKDQARDIYREMYWKKPNFDMVADVSWKIAVLLFDQGVNMGPATAAKTLQRTLNALNREGKDYPDLLVDGIIGRKTVDALKAFLNKRKDDGEKILCMTLLSVRMERYIEIVEARKTSEAFLYGWAKRVLDYMKHVI